MKCGNLKEDYEGFNPVNATRCGIEHKSGNKMFHCAFIAFVYTYANGIVPQPLKWPSLEVIAITTGAKTRNPGLRALGLIITS